MIFGAKSNQWHGWFAWRPVTLMDDGRKVWLRRVERFFMYSTWPRCALYRFPVSEES